MFIQRKGTKQRLNYNFAPSHLEYLVALRIRIATAKPKLIDRTTKPKSDPKKSFSTQLFEKNPLK